VVTVEDIAVCCEGDWGGLLTSIVGFAVVNSAKVRVVRRMHELLFCSFCHRKCVVSAFS
jgi:hypothetical protein